jgi:hypothetical protein
MALILMEDERGEGVTVAVKAPLLATEETDVCGAALRWSVRLLGSRQMGTCCGRDLGTWQGRGVRPVGLRVGWPAALSRLLLRSDLGAGPGRGRRSWRRLGEAGAGARAGQRGRAAQGRGFRRCAGVLGSGPGGCAG